MPLSADVWSKGSAAHASSEMWPTGTNADMSGLGDTDFPYIEPDVFFRGVSSAGNAEICRSINCDVRS